MLKKLKVFITLLITCLLLVVGLSSCGGVHPDPLFNIGNGFDQKVTVHFQG